MTTIGELKLNLGMEETDEVYLILEEQTRHYLISAIRDNAAHHWHWNRTSCDEDPTIVLPEEWK